MLVRRALFPILPDLYLPRTYIRKNDYFGNGFETAPLHVY